MCVTRTCRIAEPEGPRASAQTGVACHARVKPSRAVETGVAVACRHRTHHGPQTCVCTVQLGSAAGAAHGPCAVCTCCTEDGAAVTLGAHSHNRAYIGRARGWASDTSLAPDRIAHRRGGAQLRSSLDFHSLRCGGGRYASKCASPWSRYVPWMKASEPHCTRIAGSKPAQNRSSLARRCGTNTPCHTCISGAFKK